MEVGNFSHTTWATFSKTWAEITRGFNNGLELELGLEPRDSKKMGPLCALLPFASLLARDTRGGGAVIEKKISPPH